MRCGGLSARLLLSPAMLQGGLSNGRSPRERLWRQKPRFLPPAAGVFPCKSKTRLGEVYTWVFARFLERGRRRLGDCPTPGQSFLRN